MRDLAGKLAVITGGASGIGRAIAERLAREGMRAVICDIEEAALNATVEELRQSGADVAGATVDVTRFESVQSAARRIEAEHGPVHILLNNAGVGALEDVAVWELPLNDWRWTFAVNVWGVIHGMKAFLPAMLEHGQPAHVVNTSSGNGGLVLVPSTPIYSASKAAVSSITETLHLQLAARKASVRASVLYPGPGVVASNIFDAKRNRHAEFEREAPQVMPPITLADMKEYFAATGTEFEVTPPAAVAEDFLDGILNDRYFMLPRSERLDAGVRARTDAVLRRSDPKAAAM
jgi:NAD(P)-dependent dehydrogenase (short-subunit alcohol dehydrogenase family)